MRVVRVTSKIKAGIRSGCRVCPRAIKVGQVVLHQHLPNQSWDLEDIWWHARCVRQLLDAAPAEHDPDQFEIVRERLLAGMSL